MKYLFFDTETTGLYKKGLPWNHKDQGRIIQVAMMLTDGQRTVATMSAMIHRPGQKIDAGAEKVHGISAKMCEENGVPPDSAMRMLLWMMSKCDTIVGHNLGFDLEGAGHLSFESSVADRWDSALFQTQKSCTQRLSQNIVKLPPTERMKRAGRNYPKPPKLIEAYRHFFGEDFEGAHDAMDDVRACAKVFWACLRENGELG